MAAVALLKPSAHAAYAVLACPAPPCFCQTYHYHVDISTPFNPLFLRYRHQHRRQLDLDVLREGAQHMCGRHDFTQVRVKRALGQREEGRGAASLCPPLMGKPLSHSHGKETAARVWGQVWWEPHVSCVMCTKGQVRGQVVF